MFELLRKKFESFIGKVDETAKSKEVELTAASKVKSLISSRIRLSEGDIEDTLWNLQLELIQSDVASETVEYLISKLKGKLLSTEVDKNKTGEFVKAKIKEVLLEALTPEKELDFLDYIRSQTKPVKIMFFGVNGTGKTTTIAKVANLLMKSNLSVVMAAGDTFRAGAIEQAEKHASALGVKVIKHQKTGDSAAVIYDAVEHAKAKGIDVVLADTAGRMQTNVNLMDEMKKIVRVNKPDLKIFIGDALTGNDAVEQARSFNSQIGIDAVILTKMDADAKGGSALAITHETKKPVIYVGMGQKYDDLKPFDRNWFVGQLI